jgi:hypothetical protein
MMARMQVTLETETQRRVRRRAGEMGVSIAEYVRKLVDRDLQGPTPDADPSMIFDLGRSSGSDIARNKDAMLDEAFASARRRSRR